MLVRHGFDLVAGHQRVRLALGAVGVEFFFVQFVDRLVDVEWRRARPFDLQPDIEPETARALRE